MYSRFSKNFPDFSTFSQFSPEFPKTFLTASISRGLKSHFFSPYGPFLNFQCYTIFRNFPKISRIFRDLTNFPQNFQIFPDFSRLTNNFPDFFKSFQIFSIFPRTSKTFFFPHSLPRFCRFSQNFPGLF